MAPTRLLALAALLLAGCSTPAAPTAASGSPSPAALAHLDVGTSGGLTADVAARPSVQYARPLAYVLTPESRGFLEALKTEVEPQRLAIIAGMRGDAEVVKAIASWPRATEEARLAGLRRIAAVACTAMGIDEPPIAIEPRDPEAPNLLAAYRTGKPLGSVTLHVEGLSRVDGVAAAGALVHELRHAAQDQLVARLPAPAAGTPGATLATGYTAAFEAIGALGGEDDLAYGDYVHLTVEYDAFQTGNMVVAAFATAATPAADRLGFVDVQYERGLTPTFDLLAKAKELSGPPLFTAVNTAQAGVNRTPARERPRMPGAGAGGRRGR